jgi:AcrR family transcriptional regulator
MQGAKTTRRGRPSTGAREALVESARELFVERDYEQVSIEEILQRSGVSRGALYHHFPSKLDLFRAVFEDSERRMIERFVAMTAGARGPFDLLLSGSRAYLRLAETSEELRRIGLGQSRRVLGWEGWREAATELGIGAIRAIVDAAIDAGELPRHDVDATALILLGALIEAATLVAVAEDRAAARARSEAVIVDLLEGLRR